MSKQHHYTATITWIGNNGAGTTRYDAYERAHTWAVDCKQTIACSSDSLFAAMVQSTIPKMHCSIH